MIFELQCKVTKIFSIKANFFELFFAVYQALYNKGTGARIVTKKN